MVMTAVAGAFGGLASAVTHSKWEQRNGKGWDHTNYAQVIQVLLLIFPKQHRCGSAPDSLILTNLHDDPRHAFCFCVSTIDALDTSPQRHLGGACGRYRKLRNDKDRGGHFYRDRVWDALRLRRTHPGPLPN